MRKKKMSPLARDILAGMNTALAYVKGKPTPKAVKHLAQGKLIREPKNDQATKG